MNGEKKVPKQDFEAKRMVLMGISSVERRSDLESEDIGTNLSSAAYFVTLHRPYKLSAAKSLQSCPTLCDPIDGSPPGSPVPGILQARTLEWVAVAFSGTDNVSVQFSSVAQSCPTICDHMNCSTPGLLSIINSQSPPKPMSIESVMPSNHLLLCHPLLLMPSIFPSIRVFSNESALRIR